MYGVAGWTHTAGMPNASKIKTVPRLKGKGAGSGRFSGFDTGKRQQEYQDKRDLKAGRLENF
jgi:hypothetical protein